MGNKDLDNKEKLEKDDHVVYVDRKYAYDYIGKDDVIDVRKNIRVSKVSIINQNNVKKDSK